MTGMENMKPGREMDVAITVHRGTSEFFCDLTAPDGSAKKDFLGTGDTEAEAICDAALKAAPKA